MIFFYKKENKFTMSIRLLKSIRKQLFWYFDNTIQCINDDIPYHVEKKMEGQEPKKIAKAIKSAKFECDFENDRVLINIFKLCEKYAYETYDKENFDEYKEDLDLPVENSNDVAFDFDVREMVKESCDFFHLYMKMCLDELNIDFEYDLDFAINPKHVKLIKKIRDGVDIDTKKYKSPKHPDFCNFDYERDLALCEFDDVISRYEQQSMGTLLTKSASKI